MQHEQLSDILDVLFKPRWAMSAQVLKLEVGGDAHSTINTESSHMSVADGSFMFFSRSSAPFLFWYEVRHARLQSSMSPNISNRVCFDAGLSRPLALVLLGLLPPTRHTSNKSEASFNRGWEIFIAAEAKKRNPDIRIGGLAWGWPGWTGDSVELKVECVATPLCVCV
jgi:hypothetical protein